MALKKSHKLRLTITRVLLAIVFLVFSGEATGYSIINYFNIISFQVFLGGSGIVLYFVSPPRDVLEYHKVINLPLKMPYKTRQIILATTLLVFLTFLCEKYTSLNLFNFSDMLNFNAVMIVCGVVALLVFPPRHELMRQARKQRRPKSLKLNGLADTDIMNIIVVPVTPEALGRFEYDECVEGDLIEHFFDDKECAELFDTGVFVDINSNLKMIVDRDKNTEITGPEKLSIARDIIDSYIRNHPNNPTLKLLHSQIVYADKCRTGIFLYF